MQPKSPNTSSVGSVSALHGGEIIRPTPNSGCVAKLRELLEQAENGEIVGITCASLHGDGTASYTIAGMVGPYAMLGAVSMAESELKDWMRGEFE